MAADDTAGSERLQLALDAGELGTWDWDLKRGHIRWDERTASIFHIPLEEFDGTLETFKTIVHPDDIEGVSAAIDQAIALRGAFRRDYRVISPAHGTVHWVSVRGRVVCDAEGAPDAMLGVVQDRSDAHTWPNASVERSRRSMRRSSASTMTGVSPT